MKISGIVDSKIFEIKSNILTEIKPSLNGNSFFPKTITATNLPLTIHYTFTFTDHFNQEEFSFTKSLQFFFNRILLLSNHLKPQLFLMI